MKLRTFLPAALALALQVCITFSAAAHGGEPRLELSADRAFPGGTIEVRGVEFEPEEEVHLSLLRPGIDFPQENLVADSEGGFTHIVLLPPDLPEGDYAFRAVTDGHEVLSPSFSVVGAAQEQGGGQREQEEGLLAPMPTPPPPAPAAEPSLPLAPIRALGLLAAALGWFMLRRLKSKV
jgi:hypothetical protein